MKMKEIWTMEDEQTSEAIKAFGIGDSLADEPKGGLDYELRLIEKRAEIKQQLIDIEFELTAMQRLEERGEVNV